MSTYPTTFAGQMQPVAGDTLSDTGKIALQKLADGGYEVRLGLRESDIPTLHDISLQTSIREYCPNDCTKRFKDEMTARDWLSKGRVMVLLVEVATGTIAGYGWFGHGTTPHIPGGQETFALRVNEAYQGRGLATPYTQVLLDVAKHQYGADHLWLEAWQSNTGAIHIYEKFGFKLVTSEPGSRSTANGDTITDIRYYMQLF